MSELETPDSLFPFNQTQALYEKYFQIFHLNLIVPPWLWVCIKKKKMPWIWWFEKLSNTNTRIGNITLIFFSLKFLLLMYSWHTISL